VLYYVGVMQLVVTFFAKLMSRFMGASGAESTSVAASIFMGQTEAPLTIRPFLPEMTMSELMTIMTAGMAHISGGIMAAYVLIAKVDVIHLLTAVIMTAPGAIMMSKIIVPEVDKPKTGGDVEVVVPKQDVNVIDAAGRGAIEGLHLSLNVAGMLIAFIALVALVNGIFGYVHGQVWWFPASLDIVLGWVFRPIAWAMGVTWKDSLTVGNLLGTRMVLNEFVAFAKLGEPGVGSSLDPRSFAITTYALCGFANFSSIAIQIGGIGSLAPSRRGDLARLGLRAMIAGTLANFLTATIAGMLL
jgi:concentrative nucleoside transporter, CNT family